MEKLLTSETSNVQLYELASHLGLVLQPIVYKEDLIHMKIPIVSSNYIINLKEPSHWVALYIYIKNNRKIAYYFNSFDDYFGDIPQEIMQFIKRIGCNEYVENEKAIQDPKRGYCGEYALLFLKYMNSRHRLPEVSYNKFLNKFNDVSIDIWNWMSKHMY